jgi:hypothetical protein
MSDFQDRLKAGGLSGFKKGWHTFIWILKILVPVSFLVTLLQWTGWLDYLDFLLKPLMGLLRLPPEAALPIISGMLINLYPVIAIITVIPFTAAQMTLIAVFTLMAHNLILEGMVQHKSGYNGLMAAVSRTAAAIIAVFIISRFFGDTGSSVVMTVASAAPAPILEALRGWAVGTAYLLLRILGVIMFIMVLQECLVALGWLDALSRFFRPWMRVMGVPRQAAFIWIAANIFGLLYGGAVVMEEAKKGTLTREELRELHISIGINHSMTEDPSLFAVIGLNPFWLWVPRLVMAIIFLQSYRLVKWLGKKFRRQGGISFSSSSSP